MARVILFSYIEYMHSCLSSSVQFSCSVMSDSLWPHESQHTRPPCPSPTPGVYLNPSPSSQWCHPAISSSVIPFSSCPQSLPSSGAFPVSQLFTWGGQSIAVSALTSVLPVNTQDWSPLGWTSWISLQSKGLSRVFSSTTVQKHQFFGAQPSSQSSFHIHTWPLEKPYMALTRRTCLSRRRVIMIARCQSGKATWKNVRWLSFKSYKGSFGVTDFFFSVTVPAPINNVFCITLYPLLKQHFMEWNIHFPPSWSVLEKVEILLGLYCESNAFCHQEKVELIKLCENRAPENDLLKSADVCR